MIRKLLLFAFLVLVTVVGGKADEASQPPAAADKNGEEATRAATAAFAAAFNRHDADAIAALWDANGDYADSDGNRFQGRDEIHKQYAAMFSQYPLADIALTVDSVRQVSPNVVLQDGHAVVQHFPEELPTTNRYTAVFVQQQGKWLVSSVREVLVPPPEHHARLNDLAWLVGDWHYESPDASLEMTCRWIENRSFIERSYSIDSDEETTAVSGRQIIGWDPQRRRVTSWVFSSDGGFAMGVWTRNQQGWSIESTGYLPDGTVTRATNVLSRLDDNSLRWKSTKRMIGDAQMPDTEEIVLKRKEKPTEPVSP
jgi:uncharacterized protein (TIGR02246 family)